MSQNMPEGWISTERKLFSSPNFYDILTCKEFLRVFEEAFAYPLLAADLAEGMFGVLTQTCTLHSTFGIRRWATKGDKESDE